MSYSWQYVGDTAQASAEVQYGSYSSWFSLGTVQGSSTTLSSSVRPPASSAAKWRVRATDTRGNVSSWSEATYTLQYISTSYLAPYSSKTSGSINRFAAQTFAVQMYANGTPYTDYIIENPVFYWRQSGASTWNSVSMTRLLVNGKYKCATVSISANTFPKGTIQWYAEAGDGQGNTRTTPTYGLSTAAVPITATPIAPIDTVETANTPTVFTWSNSGTIAIYPAAAQLQYSTNNLNWTDLGSVTGSAASYTAAAGDLPSGQLFWRVRVQNVDDVWGSWSDSVTFSCVGAPGVSQVLADDKPFTTITWTSPTQQAYRITIDGSVFYGTYWGANVHDFTLPLPLADGAHTAAVEVQNEYGQWSQPAQTDFIVTNVPGEPVTLTGLFDRDAELSWSTTDATSDFLIYRDGVQIGHTSGRSFIDRVVLGFHSWRVINRLPYGYYTASNVVSGTLMTGRLAIAPLSGGAWLDLTKSENSARSVVWNESQQVVLRQFAGQIYPDAEAAPYKTMSAGFDVAWTHAEAEQAAIFAALIGQPVIFKTPCEGAMVGILTAWQRNNMYFYRSYSATVQRIHWRDYVDADD